MTKAFASVLAAAAAATLLARGATAQETMRLNGAGATFPQPI